MHIPKGNKKESKGIAEQAYLPGNGVQSLEGVNRCFAHMRALSDNWLESCFQQWKSGSGTLGNLSSNEGKKDPNPFNEGPAYRFTYSRHDGLQPHRITNNDFFREHTISSKKNIRRHFFGKPRIA